MSSTFGRVLLFRHLAICVSALMAYVLRQELRVGYAVLAIVAGSALINFTLYLLRASRRAEPVARLASPVVGIGAWTALIAVTHGVASPFVAGLWLEILLTSMVFPPRAIIAVTVGGWAALIGQQWWLGFQGAEMVLTLELGFLAGMGGLAWAFNRRAVHTQLALEREHLRLGEHVGRLEVELEDERVLGQLGENVGRLAHGLKNSVHSLRGFTSLLERDVQERGQAALGGLRSAIDDLEQLARLTLEENAAISEAQRAAGAGPELAIERALAEVRGTHPGVHWRIDLERPLPRPRLSSHELEEVLLILLRNGIEAMRGDGAGSVEARAQGDRLCIWVRDEGAGLATDDLEKIFRAGYTTKPEGSGYGLFLARRILSERGGLLEAESSDKGAVFKVTLPIGHGNVRGADAEPEPGSQTETEVRRS